MILVYSHVVPLAFDGRSAIDYSGEQRNVTHAVIDEMKRLNF
jgi:hypothetical protein